MFVGELPSWLINKFFIWLPTNRTTKKFLFDSLEEVEITMMKVIVKIMIMHVVLPEVEEIVTRKGIW